MTRPPAGHGYIDYVGNKEYFWRIETLWAAAEGIPAQEMRLIELPWYDDSCHILGQPPVWGAFANHCRRVMQADMSYPVIISPNGDVMDGMHRITRAYVEGRDTISVIRLTIVPPPDRVRSR